MKRSYIPSGKMGDGALPVLVAAALGAGAVVGAVEGFISQWFSLLILFPIGLGIAVGAATSAVIGSRQVRAPALAFGLAFLGGAVGQCALHGVQYLNFERELRGALTDRDDAESDEDRAAQAAWNALTPEQRVDLVLQEETGSTGFIGYMKFSAQQGTEIKRTGRSNGAKIDGVGYWILVAIELLIAALVAAFAALGRAKEPFCETCTRWYEPEAAVFVGGGEPASVKESTAALDAGDTGRAVSVLGPASEKYATTFMVRRCAQCQTAEAFLTVKHVTNPTAGKPTVKERWTGLITNDDYTMLERANAQAEAAAASAPPA